ncbi:hypothetical protein Tco_0772996 [Tanacetum coccineum]|uniref:Integrase catalytic domain-containing protein n=1 Tax=Tanacetum coccineum TaxID=301880 RepID=A0ABQ4ZJL4_9ASTR
MSGTILHIPPLLGTNSRNIGSPNRVDTMPTTNYTTNTMTTTNVGQNVIDENLPQLLDSREGSHVLNVHEFDKEDFTSWKVSDSNVKEDQRSISEFIADLNVEYHERALLANQKRFYKRSGRVGSARTTIDKSSETCFTYGKLGIRRKRYEKISSKEAIFTKAYESSYMAILKITFDSEFECETQEPLPPLPKLIGAKPADTSNSLIYLVDLPLNMADLTLNTCVPKKTKQTSDKVSPTCAIKKKTETKTLAILVHSPKKKDDSSAKQLLLTLMEEVKSLKEHIRFPSDNSSSVSQTETSLYYKGKQTTWCRPYDPLNPLKSRSIKETNLYENVCAGILKEESVLEWFLEITLQETQKDMAKSIVKESLLPGLLIKMENLNEVMVKKLRSDNGTMFKNHKLEEFYNKKVAKAFRVFHIRIQDVEETFHVTFSENDEAISQSCIEGDVISFNENSSFPDDEFLKPRCKVTQCSCNIKYFPYIPASDHLPTNNTIIPENNFIPADSLKLVILNQLMILNLLKSKTMS